MLKEARKTMNTQTLVSQYGRKSLTLPAEIPTNALRWKLGYIHVGAPDEEIVTLVKRLAKGYTEAQLNNTIAAALWIHHENGAEYTFVMR